MGGRAHYIRCAFCAMLRCTRRFDCALPKRCAAQRITISVRCAPQCVDDVCVVYYTRYTRFSPVNIARARARCSSVVCKCACPYRIRSLCVDRKQRRLFGVPSEINRIKRFWAGRSALDDKTNTHTCALNMSMFTRRKHRKHTHVCAQHDTDPPPAEPTACVYICAYM